MKGFFSDIRNKLYNFFFDILLESLYNSICLEAVRMIARSNCDGNEGDKLYPSNV